MQSDPYATGRIQGVVPEEYERGAWDTYWNCRRAAPSMRFWYEHYYKGDKDDVAWTLTTNIDLLLEEAYRNYGLEGVKQALETIDVLETSLNVLGTRHAVGLTGDTRLGDHLTLAKPPGESQVLPRSQIEEGRSESHAWHKQEQRTKGGGGGGGGNTDGSTRQRRGNWFANKDAKAGGKATPKRR